MHIFMRIFMRIFAFLCVLFALVTLSAAQDTNFAVGPQYLMTSGSPLLARSIATPSLSLETPLPEGRANDASADHAAIADDELLASVLEFQRQTALASIYYGAPRVSLIEISFREPSEARLAIPGSLIDSGVVELTDVQGLGLRGYGVTLAEVSAHWKSHRAAAPRRYTNEDIERLRTRG